MITPLLKIRALRLLVATATLAVLTGCACDKQDYHGMVGPKDQGPPDLNHPGPHQISSVDVPLADPAIPDPANRKHHYRVITYVDKSVNPLKVPPIDVTHKLERID